MNLIKKKNNLQKLEKLKEKIFYGINYDKNIRNILKWRNKLKNKYKIKSNLINIKDCADWNFDKNNNLQHRSGQFFKVKGVKVSNASNREVKNWSQPILTQLHGGFLAFICRETKNKGIEFLLEAKTEPGDNGDLKLCPSFQATQSNLNRAHGGNITKFADIVMNLKGSELIYKCRHCEEGARFWMKSNMNIIVKLKNPNDNRIKGENYMWVNLHQIKKLSLKNNIVNPFVKTILFML
tara:strand:- start:5119 stop:5832 length:714 start_codon:yes stop_codon:yes gene_type:complete